MEKSTESQSPVSTNPPTPVALQTSGGPSGVVIAAVLILLVLVGIGFYATKPDPESVETTPSATTSDSVTSEMAATPASDDTAQVKVDATTSEAMKTTSYDYSGTLADVTVAQNVTTVTTGGTAGGTSQATFADGKYMLLATFTDLPDPAPGFFYEGWVVRKSPFHFISTGRVEKQDGIYTNEYLSTTDFTDHARYVLTIEPDDNDPAPAEHVVEGDMAKR